MSLFESLDTVETGRIMYYSYKRTTVELSVVCPQTAGGTSHDDGAHQQPWQLPLPG